MQQMTKGNDKEQPSLVIERLTIGIGLLTLATWLWTLTYGYEWVTGLAERIAASF